LSSVRSATSFLSRAFSSSSCFRRRISVTPRPAYCFFQLMGWTALPPALHRSGAEN
jgi:hypothetical protein